MNCIEIPIGKKSFLRPGKIITGIWRRMFRLYFDSIDPKEKLFRHITYSYLQCARLKSIRRPDLITDQVSQTIVMIPQGTYTIVYRIFGRLKYSFQKCFGVYFKLNVLESTCKRAKLQGKENLFTLMISF